MRKYRRCFPVGGVRRDFLCGFCKRTFKNQEHYFNHFDVVHGEGALLQCVQCHKVLREYQKTEHLKRCTLKED